MLNLQKRLPKNGKPMKLKGITEKIADYLLAGPNGIKILGVLVKHHGIKKSVKIVALIFLGFIMGWVFIWFDFFVPNFLVFKYTKFPNISETAINISSLKMLPISHLPRSLEHYRFWLEKEATSDKNLAIITGSKICCLTSADQDFSVKEFRWKLEATHDDHEISGQVFIMTKDEFLKALLPIEITKRNDPSKKAPSLRFAVPKLSKGNKLIAVICLKGKETDPSGNCNRLVRSLIQ